MGKLTREQAIKVVGIESVLEVEGDQVGYTGRVTGNDWVEFSATVDAIDPDGYKVKLVMYVMVSQSELDSVEELDGVDWDKAVSEAQFDIV
jgi:hypothetical protein